MNKKINKNLIFLGALVVFLGFSQVADAAYVCDQYVGPGTNRIVTNCWNSNQVPSNSYTNTGGLGSTNENTGFGQQLGYVSDGGAPTYNGNAYNNGYNNNGSTNGSGVNTTNTSNGVSTNDSSTNRTLTLNRNRNTTSSDNKVATNTQSNNDTNNSVAGTTNVSNTEGSNLSANGLTALSLEGSNNFLPDTVWEWICVFFLILVIIILIRQFKGKSGHDVHHATPHH